MTPEEIKLYIKSGRVITRSQLKDPEKLKASLSPELLDDLEAYHQVVLKDPNNPFSIFKPLEGVYATHIIKIRNILDDEIITLDMDQKDLICKSIFHSRLVVNDPAEAFIHILGTEEFALHEFSPINDDDGSTELQ